MTTIIQLFKGRKGGREEFTELLRPHIDLMFRMAYRWTQCRQDAEDLLQDILLKLTGRLDDMRHIQQLRPWLVRILYNRHVDLYRRKQNTPVVNEADLMEESWQVNCDSVVYSNHFRTGYANELQRVELQQVLLNALSSLSEDQQDTILLHDVEGYTAIEVAEILGINVGTVKSRLHRARNYLKKVITPGTFSEPDSCQLSQAGN